MTKQEAIGHAVLLAQAQPQRVFVVYDVLHAYLVRGADVPVQSHWKALAEVSVYQGGVFYMPEQGAR
jgi:hypothetical protein